MSAEEASEQAPRVFGGADDLHTVALLGRHLASEPCQPVTAVFFDEATAEIFADVPGVEALAWGPQLARRIAGDLPPSPLDFVAPPPVVVGDAPMARFVVQAWIRGWSEPGQRFIVHCIGRDPAWAQEVRDETEPEGKVTWSASVLRPGPVVGRVRELVAQWVRPPENRGVATGPSVVVATEDELTTVAVATAIARQVPDARVVAVVSGATPWPSIPGVRGYCVDEAMAPQVARRATPPAALARLMLADHAWLTAPGAEATAPEVPLFGGCAYADGLPVGWDDQQEQVREEVRLVAERCEQILEAGRIALAPSQTPTEQPIILSPGELRAMADEILAALGLEPTPKLRLSALELAARLPILAKRAGFVPERPVDYEQALDFASVEALAVQVHYTYEQVGAATGNASGSSLAELMWDQLSDFHKASNRAALTGSAVAFAQLGFDWRLVERPVPPALDDDVVKELGELEHRRWAINERRNGRPDHKWAIPWEEVEEGTREYDYAIVRALPGILGKARVEVFKAD